MSSHVGHQFDMPTSFELISVSQFLLKVNSVGVSQNCSRGVTRRNHQRQLRQRAKPSSFGGRIFIGPGLFDGRGSHDTGERVSKNW